MLMKFSVPCARWKFRFRSDLPLPSNRKFSNKKAVIFDKNLQSSQNSLQNLINFLSKKEFQSWKSLYCLISLRSFFAKQRFFEDRSLLSSTDITNFIKASCLVFSRNSDRFTSILECCWRYLDFSKRWKCEKESLLPFGRCIWNRVHSAAITTMMKKGDIITKYVVYLCILTEMDEIAGWKRRN